MYSANENRHYQYNFMYDNVCFMFGKRDVAALEEKTIDESPYRAYNTNIHVILDILILKETVRKSFPNIPPIASNRYQFQQICALTGMENCTSINTNTRTLVHIPK